MRYLTGRFIVGALTFLIGVGAASVWLYRRPHQPSAALANQTSTRTPEPRVGGLPAERQEQPQEESPEAKAVRVAEEFVGRNGYTDLPPARDGLSYETVEMASSVEEMLEWRYDTLERTAYGVMYRGRMGTGGGWTVIFRHRLRNGEERDGLGRAVTMDRDFKNLLVEHKPFPLANVDKRL